MELPNSSDEHEDAVLFFDAYDEFPFYDCSDSFDDQLKPSTSSSVPQLSPETSNLTITTLRRRRSSSISKADSVDDKPHKNSRDLGENGEKSELTQRFAIDENESEEHSSVTRASEIPLCDSVDSASELDGSSFNLIFFLVGLVIKAIVFQTNLFINFVTFPIWVFFNLYMFVVDPFQTIRRCRECFIGKVTKFTDFVWELVSPFVHEWFKDQNSFWKLALRYGWGLLCGFYVFFVLCCLLASSLLFSGLLMRCLVEEPVQMKQVLNFDFTKVRPVAYVPIISCENVGCGVGCDEHMDRGQMGYRVIPASHKLQITVLLKVPESEYNRNLGVFQVRVDLASIKGETLASTSHPCMLQFRSEPIRLLSTFLRVAPLITGYVSESQTLSIKFKGFVEGDIPTACLKVSIEQRAEYRPGAGIPEIYDSSLVLESELPLLRRLLWNWKITLLVWISVILFMMEFLFALVCCRPILMPRIRTRAGRVRRRTTGNQNQTRL